MSKHERTATSGISEFWRFLISIRLTVMVLASLAATSIIGTLIPQNQAPMVYLQAYGDTFYRIFNTLDIFDMYRSWWFRALILALTANIIACSADRLKSLWKVVFTKDPKFSLASFQKLKNRESARSELSPEALKPDVEARLRRAFGHTRTEPTETGYAVFAEKGRWTRLGVYVVHLSVVLLLIGALIGSIFGFEGFVTIPEGESVRTIPLRGSPISSQETRTLDFEIRCDEFDVSFYETGAPREFLSKLTLIQDGAPVYEKVIEVNDPLRYKGINIFQSSYGNLPPDIETIREKGVKLAIISRESGMSYTETAFPDKPIQLPEGGGNFVIRELTPSFLFMGQRDLGATVVGEVISPEGETTVVRLPLRFARFDRMRQNARFTFSVEGVEPRFYTGLQVTSDPGVPLVYAGFILMILGCYVTFFMNHQRVCLEVAAEGKGSRVTLTGTSDRDKGGMALIVRRLSRDLMKPHPSPDAPTGQPTR